MGSSLSVSGYAVSRLEKEEGKICLETLIKRPVTKALINTIGIWVRKCACRHSNLLKVVLYYSRYKVGFWVYS